MTLTNAQRDQRELLDTQQEALILEALTYSRANPKSAQFDEIMLGANLETATNRNYILDSVDASEKLYRARRWFNNEVLHGKEILQLEERIRRLC